MNPVQNVIPRIPDTNIGPAPGDEEHVQPLPAAIGTHHSGATVIVSAWKPSEAELAALLAGGPIYMVVFSPRMVPVMLTTAQPIRCGDGEPPVILTADHPDYLILSTPLSGIDD